MAGAYVRQSDTSPSSLLRTNGQHARLSQALARALPRYSLTLCLFDPRKSNDRHLMQVNTKGIVHTTGGWSPDVPATTIALSSPLMVYSMSTDPMVLSHLPPSFKHRQKQNITLFRSISPLVVHEQLLQLILYPLLLDLNTSLPSPCILDLAPQQS